MFYYRNRQSLRFLTTILFLLSLFFQSFAPVSWAADSLPPTPVPPLAITIPASVPSMVAPVPRISTGIEAASSHAAIINATLKLIDYYGPRYSLADLTINVEDDWAVGTLPSAIVQNTFLSTIYIIGHREHDVWRVLEPAIAPEDSLLLVDIPSKLLSPEQKAFISKFPLFPTTVINPQATFVDDSQLYIRNSSLIEPRQLYLDNRDGGQLILLLPEKSLIYQYNDQSSWLRDSIISARYLPDGRIIAIQDDLSLIIMDGNTSEVKLLPAKSANGPLFVSPDGHRLAYVKPMDFEDGAIPYTNGIAVYDLNMKRETVLYAIPYASIHLYGWLDDSLAVEVPYWDPATLQPSPYMFLGRLSSSTPSASIATIAQLPAIRPGSNYPDTSPDQQWLIYDSRTGRVVVDFHHNRYVVIPIDLSDQSRAEIMYKPHEALSDASWLPFFKPDLTTPLPQVISPLTKTGDDLLKQPFSLTAILLYRPTSNSVPVSAYRDLNSLSGQIRDWTGWTGTSWVYGHAYDQHEGTDYDGPNQSPWGAVYPSQTGTVGTIFIDCANTYPNPSYGTNFRITHGVLGDGNNYSTGYGHLRCETIAVQPGQTIASLTQQIAEIGNTGSSTGAHLHLNVRKNDVLVDPYELGIIGGAASGDVTTCPAPSLNSPADGFVSSSPSINFSWSALSGCTFNGYTFRIKTVNTMNSGGDTYIDTGNSQTTRSQTINENQVSLEGHNINWYNRDLYWGVRPANCSPSCDSSWSVRRFRIQPAAQCNPNGDQIALFLDGGYSGQCVVKGIGDYSNPSSIGLPNDSISSLKVGSNVKATLCRDDNYGGGCEDFTGDDSDLK